MHSRPHRQTHPPEPHTWYVGQRETMTGTRARFWPSPFFQPRSNKCPGPASDVRTSELSQPEIGKNERHIHINIDKVRELYSTCASPVVPHPSTGHAHGCLASEIGRDPAFPTRFDRTVASLEVSLLAPSQELERDRNKNETEEERENICWLYHRKMIYHIREKELKR